ncbi:DNA-binding transcriptional regulator, FadR family [Amycolatopsis sacchari]|uniref:DNA-binding transcriptional regulator, FadR family n=1 Tax=Amycolatopsis sacchari TaxID=115433 RepID=A0A1I3QZ25_9PSEU|nr:FadR/GntR family transcriptional regulator [Amycolatopsis sacchari]SFJ38397.1 DNA-binding transcriptional regulator, FadR family [Amycolatopsis sacchari]
MAPPGRSGPSGTVQATPIARLPVAEAVVNAIRQDIESGAYAVGDKLQSEATLAAQYGVSRPVVREALRACAALGLTETKTGRGTFVVASSVAGGLRFGKYSLRDLVEARPHVEIPAAGLAAQRRSADDLRQLGALVTAMAAETGTETWVRHDADFHVAIARASGNKVFESIVVEMRDALARQSGALSVVPDRQRRSDEEHRRILEAIQRGDARDATAAMADHLSAVDAALDTILKRK